MRNTVFAVSFNTSGELIGFAARLRLLGGFTELLQKTQVDVSHGHPIMFCHLCGEDIGQARYIQELADASNFGVAFIVLGEDSHGDEELYLNMLDHSHLYDLFYIKRELVAKVSGPYLADFRTTLNEGE